MTKSIFLGFLAIFLCTGAMASDGGIYTETENYTNHVKYDFNTVTYYNDAYVAPRAAVKTSRPCNARAASSLDVARPCPVAAAAPVRVKTYSEVIDHYQVYQPVTVYQPIGEYTTRRVIEAPRCKHCND